MHTHSNLFVKNIPTEINEAVLRSLFQTYGNVVSCRILKSRYRGSNNVGFVKFAKLEDAELAIQYMHLATIESVVIEVRFADQDVGERRSQSNADCESDYRPSEALLEQHPCKNLYVKGFPRQWRERDLMDFFSNFGNVVSAKVLSSRESSGRSGAGLVMMASVEEAAIALRHVDGRIPLGADIPITLRYADAEVSTRGGKIKKQAPSFESRYTPYVPDRPVKRKPYGGKQNLPLAPVLTQAAIQSSNLCPVIGQQFKLDREPPPVEKIKQEHYCPIHTDTSYLPKPHPVYEPPPPYHSTIPVESHPPEIAEAIVPKQEEQRTSLYIRNLPHDVDELRLYELFGHYGGIRSVKRLPDRDSKSRGGVGFVNYVNFPSASQAAAEMDGVRIGNNVLIITLQVRPTYNR